MWAIRSASLGAAALGLCIAASAATAEPAHNGPQQLTAAQMDQVTAGIQLNFTGVALASGSSFVVTEANGGGGSSQTTVPGGGSVESGVIGGTASAVGTSGASTATGVSTSGSVSGIPLVNVTVGGTVAGAAGQASFGFTYVSGGTYFLP